MSVLHVKAATHNSNPATVGTPNNSSSPYGWGGALANVTAGDEIRVWADATYNFAATITTTVNGAVGTPITINGANSSGTVDGTRPVLQATVAALAGLFKYGATNYYVWKHLDLDGAANANLLVEQASSVGQYWRWYDCLFHGALQIAYRVRSSNHELTNCDVYNNGSGSAGHGGIVTFGTASGTGLNLRSSRVYSNNGDGVVLGQGDCEVAFCRIYGNGACGVKQTGTAGRDIYRFNTFYNNATNHLDIPLASNFSACFNNSFNHAGNYAFNTNGRSSLADFWLWAYNHVYADTGSISDQAWLNSGWATAGDGGNLSGDPSFANPASGDFTPGASSILNRAGNGSRTIGALEPAGGAAASVNRYYTGAGRVR